MAPRDLFGVSGANLCTLEGRGSDLVTDPDSKATAVQGAQSLVIGTEDSTEVACHWGTAWPLGQRSCPGTTPDNGPPVRTSVPLL